MSREAGLELLTELGGCHAVENIVWSVLVVVDHEAPSGRSAVLESGEQVDVEEFLAVGVVNAHNIGVLVRFAGLEDLDSHAVRFRPLCERHAEELRPVILAQHLRRGAAPGRSARTGAPAVAT